MKVFSLQADPNSEKAGYIDVQHRWGLPGVTCDTCGNTWGTVGLEYPTVDLSHFPGKENFEDLWPVPLSRFIELEQAIESVYRNLPVLRPGTHFGNSIGTAKGSLHGFVWGAWWTVSLDGESLALLRDADLTLPPAVKVDLKSKGSPEVFELELPLAGSLMNGRYDGVDPDLCSACGRDSATMPETPVVSLIDGERIPDVFRLSNFTTLILASERFVSIVNALKIPGVLFTDLESRKG